MNHEVFYNAFVDELEKIGFLKRVGKMVMGGLTGSMNPILNPVGFAKKGLGVARKAIGV